MKNLLLLPSSIAVYILLLAPLQDVVFKSIDQKKVDVKDVVTFVFFVASVGLQQVLRYSEDSDKALFTPKMLPGRNYDNPMSPTFIQDNNSDPLDKFKGY